jgi:hypothetical protein
MPAEPESRDAKASIGKSWLRSHRTAIPYTPLSLKSLKSLKSILRILRTFREKYWKKFSDGLTGARRLLGSDIGSPPAGLTGLVD